jgi:5-carboxymethyl-2-hydroxymuconate isomerase
MPHIIVEATPRLGAALDLRALFSLMHRRIVESGHAELNDFKSRVHVTAHHLTGEDGEGEFVVARLAITNPRPKSTLRAMAQVIHDVLRTATESEQRPYWWQCRVLIETFDKQDYRKADSHALEARRILDRS